MNPFSSIQAIWPALRPLLFQCDPEWVHEKAISFLKFSEKYASQTPYFCHPQKHFGLDFPNPIGLAAGFDKNAHCLATWQSLGFGFVEVGTVTFHAQEGNPRPRLFRLVKDRALFNRMGFNNDGAQRIAERMGKQRVEKKIAIPVGVNIGKSRSVSLEEAPADYLRTFKIIADVADYVVINVSSPNTPGLRGLQHPDALSKLLEPLLQENLHRKTPVPLLLKLSSDLCEDEARTAAHIALHFQLDGLILGNTSTDSSLCPAVETLGSGGISGSPLFARSTHLLRELASFGGDRLVLIGCGGILNAEHAREKFDAGAKLLQVFTGFVYGGPLFPHELLEDER
ncbi:MAG: quinone-dependent dihydroorotate dehydrogenase [Deltaproteobacteria bacterium]|nr:quinone-dependent dihydroorotate dehydrogenase [Deltaproteobacteria bacterium]